MATARYIGGPLDGQQATKRGGRWCSYRDDHGQPLDPARGDREFCSWAGRPLRRYYRHQTSSYDGEALYVHATVADSWRAHSS